VVAYSKNESDNIPAGDKRYIKELIRRQKEVFSRCVR